VEIAHNLNTGRGGPGHVGTQSHSLVFSGEPVRANTEDWNGASWTEVGDLNTGRDKIGGTGTTSLALAFGGSPHTTHTEEWSGSSVTTEVLSD
jgi:hypothetical protein